MRERTNCNHVRLQTRQGGSLGHAYDPEVVLL
jgi:hypothetical protein